MYLPERTVEPTDAAAAAEQRDALARYATTDDAGRLLVRYDPRPSGVAYLVRRVVIQGPQGSICRLYAGEVDPLNLADATASGWSDVADYAQPLFVPPYTPLVVLWERTNGDNYPAGTVACARIELEEIR